MKVQILFFILFSLTVLRCQERTVFLYVFDSSNSTTQGADGESQFFDYPSGSTKTIPLVVSSNSTQDLFEIVKPSLAAFGLNPNTSDSIKIQSTKSYWRHSGYLPYPLVISELDLANADHFHTPDMNVTQLSVMYFVYRIPIVGQAYQIKHHVVEVCAKVAENDTRHFIVDRGYNGIYPNIWNSRIRIIYTGKANNCHLDDNAWADKRAGTWNNSGVITPHLNVAFQGHVFDYTLENLVDDVYAYFQTFPIYNTLINCQHFGSNLHNKQTLQNVTFMSDDVLLRILPNGQSNLKGLRYGFVPRDDKRGNLADRIQAWKDHQAEKSQQKLDRDVEKDNRHKEKEQEKEQAKKDREQDKKDREQDKKDREQDKADRHQEKEDRKKDRKLGWGLDD